MSLKSPKCGHEESYVVDVRKCTGGIRRRRECDHSGTRFTTYEAGTDVTKAAIIKQLIPILSKNIREALRKTLEELKHR